MRWTLVEFGASQKRVARKILPDRPSLRGLALHGEKVSEKPSPEATARETSPRMARSNASKRRTCKALKLCDHPTCKAETKNKQKDE
mmetsp:Transcript_76421/g.212282  ORF Transcript_76421/g.212282 Transcript_76421/m.212282 type:complete len:87 (+) Transcript_76421:151-411(+)